MSDRKLTISLLKPRRKWYMSREGFIEHIEALIVDTCKQYGFNYGFKTWFGNFFSFATVDTVEHVLLKHHQTFPKSCVYEQDLCPFLGKGLLTSSGEQWRRLFCHTLCCLNGDVTQGCHHFVDFVTPI